MEQKIINLLQESPIIIPRILLNNYHRLGITEEELLIISIIISFGGHIEYNPDVFEKELCMDRHKVMSIISSLMDKKIISLEVIKINKKAEEYLSLELMYQKLMNYIVEQKDESQEIDNSVFSIFENELGRLLSPMETEKIKEWVSTYNNKELIIEALKEAVLNGVSNFRYIDTILNEWSKKGYKTKNDIVKDHENYHKSKEKNNSVVISEYDWLNNE